MCLAVPARISSVDPDGKARIQTGGADASMEISTILLPEPPHVGDFVIVHAGFALRVLDPQEAEESLKIFRQIAELPLDENGSGNVHG
ncbi:MAG: HypC/HybG/HupF family hydrogenase formation chaperone [Desulfovibrio sp.]|jgi:hydrogenase expression/formation protein HypC|nr:HypC/HybG/HupF family hydrogenase formation chaperone [Mailhella sp.]